ncbi:MAG: alanine racemase, partial [bacterium]
VLTLMCYLDYPVDVIVNRMKMLVQVAMRLEIKRGINKCTIINDTYNSDPASLDIALNFLNQQNHQEKKSIILSDILQTGQYLGDLYKDVAKKITRVKSGRFIGIGPDIGKYKNLFDQEDLFFETTDDFLSKFPLHVLKNETILLKGARNFQFEKISRRLEQKMHKTVLEIDLNALIHNLNFFRSLLNPGTKIMVMVKALAYGSGMNEIASLLQHQRVDYLGVAFADEGTELRQAGVSLPIIVMSPSEDSLDQIIEYNLEPEIYNIRILHEFNKVLLRNNAVQYPVHLKLDTGMHRLGFDEGQMEMLIRKLSECQSIKVKTIFTHLAAADEKVHDEFTHLQASRFKKMSQRLMNAGFSAQGHILNSSGIERFAQYQYDMVRLGIGLYGVGNNYQGKLQQVSTLKTCITQIKTVPANDTIGYGRNGKASTETKIATIPIGYADGINRKLSNGHGKFLVNGKFAPVIGNICMDMCMLDITHIDTEEGDEVIVFGREKTISDLANELGTIPYEILTSISGRVKRIYYQE